MKPDKLAAKLRVKGLGEAEFKITVGIPAYNAEEYVEEAINSILAQNISGLKIIVIDDGSTDKTFEVIKKYENYANFIIVKQENAGLGATLNRLISMCTTPYLARMDADDIAMPERLMKQIKYLEDNPAVDAVGCQVRYFFREAALATRPTSLPSKHEEIMSLLLSNSHALCHPTLVFRTEAIKQAGGYKISGSGEDWEMFLRFGRRFRFANLSEPLYFMRMHSESITARSWDVCLRNNLYAISRYKYGSVIDTEGYEEFCQRWEGRSLLRKMLTANDGRSLYFYRLSMMYGIDRKKLLSIACILVAVTLSPKRVYFRLKRKIFSRRLK